MTNQLNKLYIEPTTKCNFHCSMCFRNTWFDEMFADMSWTVYERTIATMPDTVNTVFFGGMGEPLFYPRIIDMVRLAATKVNQIELLTNGSLLNFEMAQQLLKSGLSKLWISIDAFKTQDSKRVGHDYEIEKIIDNIAAYNKARSMFNPQAKLAITFVAMKSNLHQLGFLPQFMIDHAVDEANISNVYPSDVMAAQEVLYEKTVGDIYPADNPVHQGSLFAYIVEAAQALADFPSCRPQIKIPFMDWDREDVQLALKQLFEFSGYSHSIFDPQVGKMDRYCRFIDEGTAFVRFDGAVCPCMATLHSGIEVWKGEMRKVYQHSFGNINQQCLNDIWQSKDYSAFRDRVKNFDFPSCVHCTYCDYFNENVEDCYGNVKPTCGGCLWSQGIIICP